MGWKYHKMSVFLDVSWSFPYPFFSYLCTLHTKRCIQRPWGFISSIVREGCQFGILAGEFSQQIDGKTLNPPSILEVFCWPWFLDFKTPVNIDTFDTWGQQSALWPLWHVEHHGVSNQVQLPRVLLRSLGIVWLSFLESWHTLSPLFWGGKIFWVHELAVWCPSSSFKGSEGWSNSLDQMWQPVFMAEIIRSRWKTESVYHVLPLTYF